MTAGKRTALRTRLVEIEVELTEAYLHEQLHRPPFLRTELALMARLHLPALLDADDALAAAQAEAAALREALQQIADYDSGSWHEDLARAVLGAGAEKDFVAGR